MNDPLDPIPINDVDLNELEEDEATQQESQAPEDLGPGKRKIFTDKTDPPISALCSRYTAGDLVLDPIFQRRKVWDDRTSSRLIESVILEVPLPVFYLAEGPDGEEEVIDGQQRLTAFFRFLENQYPLKGLKALPQLNGKHFKDLDRATQRLIRGSSVRTITFKKESDENLRFEIFERLNTGAVPLNRQELRNCVYHGQYNELLGSLSKDPDYMALMGLKEPERRMKDVEYVLRFAAFHHATYLKYKSPMDRFLDEDMKKYQKAGDQEQEELRTAFKTAVTLVRSLLGPHAFRRFYRGTEENPAGYWEPKKFNASLYDILMGSFADKDKNQVMANLDAIREALIVLMTEDQSFVEAIELSTSSVKMVTRRFDIWRRALGDILEKSTKQPRTFSREQKQALHAANPTCAICKQHIADLDDAAVDHIEQYWLGGKTIPENARLAHRYCNSSRPRKETATQKE
jgi:5-methylcytosine-specific restriction endonuclease McrA